MTGSTVVLFRKGFLCRVAEWPGTHLLPSVEPFSRRRLTSKRVAGQEYEEEDPKRYTRMGEFGVFAIRQFTPCQIGDMCISSSFICYLFSPQLWRMTATRRDPCISVFSCFPITGNCFRGFRQCVRRFRQSHGENIARRINRLKSSRRILTVRRKAARTLDK